jgi:hypothetical protein
MPWWALGAVPDFSARAFRAQRQSSHAVLQCGCLVTTMTRRPRKQEHLLSLG